MPWSRPLRRLLPALFALTLATQAGCSKHAMSASAEPPAPSPAAPASASGSLAPQDRAVRVTVEVTILAAHRDLAVQRLRAKVAELSGYVSQGGVSGSDEAGSASFEVKVPAAKVDALRQALHGLGEVRADSEKAEDVTEARADVHARVASARAEEARFLALLSDRTGSLADVLAVEKELARVRETIERFEAEQRVLEGQITMATVKVQIETSFVAAEASAGSRLAIAAREGGDNARAFLVGAGIVLLSTGPTLALVLGLAYAAFLVVRGARRRLGREPSR